MRIQLFGPVSAVTDDGETVAVGGPLQRAVLAVLAAEPGVAVTSDTLSEAVWGEQPPDGARRSLSTYVANLRRGVGDAIVSAPNGYRCTLDRPAVDVTAFADQMDAAIEARDPGGLADALNLWTGEPFADVETHGQLVPVAAGLHELRLRGIEVMAETGAPPPVSDLEALVAEYPTREGLRAALMRALYAAGRQADALATYRDYETHLRDDLGLDPAPELRELELQILDHRLDTAAAAEPQAAYAAPPLRYSSFVGRAEVLEEIGSRLAERRIVTITGTGGIGKSSAASEVTRTLGESPIAYLNVEAVPEGSVKRHLAEALGLSIDSMTDVDQVLIGHLADRNDMLFLDGCERRGDEVAECLHGILSATPGVRALLTSREPLGLAGESVLHLGGLSKTAAFELFADRAELGPNPDRVAVDELLERLDGIPLAIELTAARSRAVPLDHVVASLDRPDATGVLDATLAATYESLGDEDARALLFMSLFRRGFNIDLADAVLETPIDSLARLVEVSLVEPPDATGRYRMLEPVRQFAIARLVQSGEGDLAKAAHARAFASISSGLFRDLWTQDRRTVEQRIWSARYDLAAALEWSASSGDLDAGITILGYLGNAMATLEMGPLMRTAATAIVETPDPPDNPLLPVAMANVAWLNHYATGEKNIALLDEAEAIARDRGSSYSVGRVLERRAVILRDLSLLEPAEVEAMILEAEQLMDGGPVDDSKRGYSHAALALLEGDPPFDQSRAYIAVADEWYWETTRTRLSMVGMVNAAIAWMEGRPQDASHQAREVAEARRAAGAVYQSQASWAFSAVFAYLAGLDDEVRFASDALEETYGLTGILNMWQPLSRLCRAATDAEWDEGVDLVRSWCADRIEALGTEAEGAGLRSRLWRLEFDRWPFGEFPLMLEPLSRCLMGQGQTEAAASIAASVISLPDAGFPGSNEDLAHWKRLAGDAQPAPSLERLFELVSDAVDARTARPSRPDEEWPGGF